MEELLGRVDFAAKRPTSVVYIEELGGSIKLRGLSAGQSEYLRTTGLVGQAHQWLAQAIVDEKNERIYKTDEDIQNLSEMSSTIAGILMNELNRIMGLSSEAEKDFKKKSASTPASGSVSN